MAVSERSNGVANANMAITSIARPAAITHRVGRTFITQGEATSLYIVSRRRPNLLADRLLWSALFVTLFALILVYLGRK